MKKNEKQLSPKSSILHKSLTVIGVILCVILIPILTINIILIVKSYVNPDSVPDVAGTLPLIVLTDSMSPEIQSGDLVICRTTEAESVQEGDIIAFFDPAGSGSSVTIHRVTEVVTEDGKLSFRTKGDANNTEDASLVPADKLVGRYRFRIAGAGHIALFVKSPAGPILCVACPLVFLIIYDTIRRRRYERRQRQTTEALMEELESLREQVKASDSQNPEAAESREDPPHTD